MVDAFSLKLQRNNRQNALAVDSAKGKTGKKAVFWLHCGDETTIYYNRAKYFAHGGRQQTLNRVFSPYHATLSKHSPFRWFSKGSVIVYGCFISTVWWKYRIFLKFLVDGFHNCGILLAIPLEFQEIKHQPFPMTQPF